ncbi:hypothetical protein XAB3213_4680005 [Xanthomonas citri pv. bilvae]|nr:hypothetical protein XAB3213_4680005 [Xanthomonas citri pv. bilvae]
MAGEFNAGGRGNLARGRTGVPGQAQRDLWQPAAHSHMSLMTHDARQILNSGSAGNAVGSW